MRTVKPGHDALRLCAGRLSGARLDEFCPYTVNLVRKTAAGIMAGAAIAIVTR